MNSGISIQRQLSLLLLCARIQLENNSVQNASNYTPNSALNTINLVYQVLFNSGNPRVFAPTYPELADDYPGVPWACPGYSQESNK